MRKTLAIIMAVVILAVFVVPSRRVDAVVSIDVYLESNTGSVNLGDILEVRVMAGRMPNILSFNNVKLDYDPVSLIFMSAEASTDLPDTFSVSVNNDDNLGEVSISGSDQTAEDYINEHFNAEDGEEDEDFEDPSFSSSGPTCLCTLRFRVKTSAFNTLNFTFGEGIEFINSSEETVEGKGDSTFVMDVTSDVSKNAALYSIKINNSPVADFKSDSYDYMYSVNKDTGKIQIDCEPSNLFAQYEVSDTDLKFGDNNITIDVTAQDGVTKTQYRIVVNRPSQVSSGTAAFFDSKDKLFTFVSRPDDVNIPSGFTETTMTINGYEVPCFVSDGLTQVLIYVLDEEGNTDFRVYNPKSNKVTNYSVENSIFLRSSLFTVKNLPKGVTAPKGFMSVKVWIEGREYKGFVNASGTVIFYLEIENGSKGFYEYHQDTQSFSKYEGDDNKTDKIYNVLFHICLIIAIVEALLIIIIVYVVRRFRKERVNPRPRRV